MFGHGLPDGRYIMLAARIHPLRPTSPNASGSDTSTADEIDRGPEEGHRALLLFTTNEGVHGFADYAVDNGQMTITA